MILGILSDTHGRHERAARAIQVLQEHGAEVFIHCGDVGGERVFDELAGRRAFFVWGNCDVRDALLERYVCDLGLPLPATVPLRLELDGRKLAVFHGHEREFAPLAAAFAAGCDALPFSEAFVAGRDAPPYTAEPALGGCDYVFYGHTHMRDERRFGATRVINPGALHRAAVLTVATLDLATDKLTFLEVERE